MTFNVTLATDAALQIALVTTSGKTVTRFTLYGRKGLNNFSAYVPASAANKGLTLKITVTGNGQKHTISEQIGKTHRR